MIIGGLQKSSLIDYPEMISAIVFTKGCNFRCPYCHNPELIFSDEGAETDVSTPSVLEFLKKRQGKLDGVVITGGEPTLHNDLPAFLKEIKKMNFKIKLDTNGTKPALLSELIGDSLIDYVAMDIKAPIEKYSQIACCKVDEQNILESIELIMKSGLDYEFRTTVLKSQLEFEDFEKISLLIKGAKKYYLQRFVPTKTLNKFFMSQRSYEDIEFEPIIKMLKNNIETVALR